MKDTMIPFQYDEEAKAGYVYLRKDLKSGQPGESKKQVIITSNGIENGEHLKAELIVDLDENGRIVGVEILGDTVIPDYLKV